MQRFLKLSQNIHWTYDEPQKQDMTQRPKYPIEDADELLGDIDRDGLLDEDTADVVWQLGAAEELLNDVNILLVELAVDVEWELDDANELLDEPDDLLDELAVEVRWELDGTDEEWAVLLLLNETGLELEVLRPVVVRGSLYRLTAWLG